jgi:hypothetical protein
MGTRGLRINASIVAALIMVALIAITLINLELSLREDGPDPRTEVLFNETWEANSLVPPDGTMELHEFTVDEGVEALEITFAIRLTSRELVNTSLGDLNVTFDPYMTLSLSSPDGPTEWQSWFNATAGDTVVLKSPTAGTWTLLIKTRGYGTDVPDLYGLPFPFHDHVHVVIEAS